MAAAPYTDQPRTASVASDVSDIWNTLRRGKWIILAVCLLAAGAAAAYTMTIPPTYAALSVVSLSSRANAVPGIEMSPVRRPSAEEELGRLRNSMELSRRVADRLLESAEALGSRNYFPALRPDENGEEPSTSLIARRLRNGMSFEPYEIESQILFRSQSTSPEEAALVANLYAQEYQAMSQELSRSSLVAVREFVEGQVKQWEGQMNALDSRWESFAQNRSFLTEGESGQQVASEYTGLVRRVENAKLEIENQRLQRAILTEQLSTIEPDLANDATSGLTAQIAALEQQIAQLRLEAEQYYNNNPDLRGNEASVPELQTIVNKIANFERRRTQLREQLVNETLGGEGVATQDRLSYASQLKTRRVEIDNRIRELEGEIDVLQASIDEYANRLDRVPRQIVETQQLEIRREMTRQRYVSYFNKLQDIQIAEQAEQGFVEVLREARVPYDPVAPDMMGNILLATLVGLILGTGIVFVRASAHTRLQDPGEVQRLGYDIAGVIPAMDREIKTSFKGKPQIEVEGRMLSTQLVTLLNPWSPISENYRMVRTNLQLGQRRSTPQVMLVTSPEMSDGKTVNAVNLAIAMTQSGHRTLLIDADLRRPAVHKMLDLKQKPGLAELLATLNGESPSIDTFATDIHNLYVLPAGKVDMPPPELLGSNRMANLLAYMRDSFDTIIIDSPPVLAATDAVVLASVADACLVVVRADRTDTRVLDAACSRLINVGAPIAGIIFNRFDTKKAGRDSYNYAYTQEYYAQEPS